MVTDDRTGVSKKPSWTLVMSFEEAIRKKAAKLMNDSAFSSEGRTDIALALKTARACNDTKNKFFYGKFLLEVGTSRRQRSRTPPAKIPKDKVPKDKRGGGKKGGGKGQGGKKTPPGNANNISLASDFKGQKICFPFNSKKGCNRHKCNMMHVCQICTSSKHGVSGCPNAN